MPVFRKYTLQQIKTAQRLRAQGLSTYVIAEKVGFKCPHTVLYYTDPDYKKRHFERCYAWRRNNRERFNEICAKASKKFLAKKKQEV